MMTKVLALQCKYHLILTCKFRTFPSSVAMMMLDAVPKGSTSLTTSLSDQPLSASPEISTRPSCRNDIRNLAGFDNSKNETELFIKSQFTWAGAIGLAPSGGKESKVKRKSRTTKICTTLMTPPDRTFHTHLNCGAKHNDECDVMFPYQRLFQLLVCCRGTMKKTTWGRGV